MRNNSQPHQISLFEMIDDAVISQVSAIRRRHFRHVYDNIISVENLLQSWREFLNGKRNRKDVADFSLELMDEILKLHEDLAHKVYHHGTYQAFKINDPKPRDIHKAKVRDRLIHHAIYRILYPLFDKRFIFDSYSCRKKKGTHRAMKRFTQFGRKISRNNTKTVWVLKCDIQKFFANIDHNVLSRILAQHINDAGALWLLEEVIGSFRVNSYRQVGLPLGNLTSQLLINIYMNEFDQFAKRTLKAKYYIRYADDFVFLHESKQVLIEMIPRIEDFLKDKLKLTLNPHKVYIRTLNSGIDFLGWVHFPNHRVLRTTTKKRMFRKLELNRSSETIASYKGILSHGNTYKLTREVGRKFPEFIES